MAKDKTPCPICGKLCKSVKIHISRAHPNTAIIDSKSVEATMPEKSELSQLMSLASTVGINGDKLLEELSQAIISRLPPVEIDWQKLIGEVSTKVETKVAAKLAEVLEALKVSTDGSKPDNESIIKGVANLLQPQIIQAANQASEAAFAVNSQALIQQLEERLKPPETEVTTRGQAISNMSAGSLLQALLAQSENIAKIVQIFRPPPTPEIKAAELLSMSLRLADKIDKVKSGHAQIDELTKDISDSLAQKK